MSMYVVVNNARVVNIIKPFTETVINGRDGQPYQAKEILFTFAVDRKTRRPVIINGRQTTQAESDFYLARAKGSVAENFNKYCTATKEDGNLVRRRLFLQGHFESYDKMRSETRTVNIGGAAYDITFDDIKQKNYIFIVEGFEFNDGIENSNQAHANANGATVSSGPIVMPVNTQTNVVPQNAGVPATPVVVNANAPQAQATIPTESAVGPVVVDPNAQIPFSGANNTTSTPVAPAVAPNFDGQVAPY